MSLNILQNYKESLQAIYDHVGFVEDWVIYPIDTQTSKFWYVNKEDNIIEFADTEKELLGEDGNYYSQEIYTQRFYKKWVYEGIDFTLVFVNSGVDGMKYFSIFDNKKYINKSLTK